MWTPSSPDSNPMDYAIWGALQERLYNGIQEQEVRHADQLEQAIVLEWRALPQRFFDYSIGE